jgi:hypothetical protein
LKIELYYFSYFLFIGFFINLENNSGYLGSFYLLLFVKFSFLKRKFGFELN